MWLPVYIFWNITCKKAQNKISNRNIAFFSLDSHFLIPSSNNATSALLDFGFSEFPFRRFKSSVLLGCVDKVQGARVPKDRSLCSARRDFCWTAWTWRCSHFCSLERLQLFTRWPGIILLTSVTLCSVRLHKHDIQFVIWCWIKSTATCPSCH
jgi:hypothetical protein